VFGPADDVLVAANESLDMIIEIKVPMNWINDNLTSFNKHMNNIKAYGYSEVDQYFPSSDVEGIPTADFTAVDDAFDDMKKAVDNAFNTSQEVQEGFDEDVQSAIDDIEVGFV